MKKIIEAGIVAAKDKGFTYRNCDSHSYFEIAAILEAMLAESEKSSDNQMNIDTRIEGLEKSVKDLDGFIKSVKDAHNNYVMKNSAELATIHGALRAIENEFADFEKWKRATHQAIGDHVDSNRHELQSIHQTIGELSVKVNEVKDVGDCKHEGTSIDGNGCCVRCGNEVKGVEWKPIDDEQWFYIGEELEIYDYFGAGACYQPMIKAGNCFRTKEQAEQALERVKVAIRGNV